MSGGGWNVIRCSACSTCHGHRSIGRICPHCGQKLPSDAEIVTSVALASELRIEVALANTPEELRETLRKRLYENNKLFHQEETDIVPKVCQKYSMMPQTKAVS